MGNLCTHHRFDDRPRLQRIHNIFSIIVLVVLFLAVLLYAGFRGYRAYNHLPDTLTNFVAKTSVPYPAVTVCPLVAIPITAIECIRETATVEVEVCSAPAYTKVYNIEGINHNCLTFNDPQNNVGKILTANSSNDEFTIIVQVNVSAVPPGEQIGCLVMVHDQGFDPELEEEETFIASAGQVTEIFMSRYHYTFINGSSETEYIVRASGSAVTPEAGEDVTTLVDMDFVYTNFGIYEESEYYAYTVDQWIGEVGGFACLMIFLHHSFVWLVMTIISLIIKEDKRPSTRLKDDAQL